MLNSQGSSPNKTDGQAKQRGDENRGTEDILGSDMDQLSKRRRDRKDDVADPLSQSQSPHPDTNSASSPSPPARFVISKEKQIKISQLKSGQADIDEQYKGNLLREADDKLAKTKLDTMLAGKAVSRKLERLEKRRFLRAKLSAEAQKEMKDVYKKEKRSRREKEKKLK